MTTATDTLQTIASTLAHRVDRAEARSRTDVELTLLVLEDLADELDGYPVGRTRDVLGQPQDEPTVVLLRRFANAHHRLGVADRRCELDEDATATIRALQTGLVDGASDTVRRDHLGQLVAACC